MSVKIAAYQKRTIPDVFAYDLFKLRTKYPKAKFFGKGRHVNVQKKDHTREARVR
jgi:hypothetical protein